MAIGPSCVQCCTYILCRNIAKTAARTIAGLTSKAPVPRNLQLEGTSMDDLLRGHVYSCSRMQVSPCLVMMFATHNIVARRGLVCASLRWHHRKGLANRVISAILALEYQMAHLVANMIKGWTLWTLWKQCHMYMRFVVLTQQPLLKHSPEVHHHLCLDENDHAQRW
jgi:hypothetical protein